VISANPSQQRRLVDLQEIDTAIRQLEHRRANLPEQKALDENADTLTRVSQEYGSARDTVDRLASQQKRHEDEVAMLDARRKSEEGRMYSGTIVSPKELDALRSEISSVKSRKNDIEDALLDVMEQREDIESLVASLAERERELSAQVEVLTSARDAAAREIDAELDERRAERAKVAAEIPDEVVGYYDELRARKDGTAVAELRDKACTACRLQLTVIDIEELKADAATRIARCPHCGRILVP
jgi:uncharacterized protein